MIDWLFSTVPYTKEYALLIGFLLITITSSLFLIKIESVSTTLHASQKELSGNSEDLLTQLLLPLCTALPNFIFAFSAMQSVTTIHLVATSNIGNNVTNITIFVGLILLVGFIKQETLSKEESLSLRKDFNFLMLSTVIFFVCIWDDKITRQEGIILTICFFFSMTNIFSFRLKDIQLIFTVLSKLILFFLVAGFFIYIGSELIIYRLESMSKSGSSGIYEVLLPGFALVLPSILPLLLTIMKPNMQRVALSGIIGDSAFSIPLIVGIISCFTEEISLQQSAASFRYLLAASAIAFFSFYLILPSAKKSKISIGMVFIPFIAYGIIVYLLSKGA